MEFREIVNQLNLLSTEDNHPFGYLQHFRKIIREKRAAIISPFGGRGIKEKEKYAFHSGGRDEMQFNLGEDLLKGNTVFRYGVAFGLQQDKTLHNSVAHFTPLINRFNLFYQENPGFFDGMVMWYYSNKIFAEYFDQVVPIGDELIQTENFIFIGKYFNKASSDIEDTDISRILQVFDNLFPLYQFVQQTRNEPEKRMARICWNKYGWTEPSGPEGKSKSPESHEGIFGYGHEEWLFDFSKLIDGKMAGFLQPIRNRQDGYIGKIFNVWLYTVDGDSKKRYWVGEIPVRVISKEESDHFRSIYQERGWLEMMEKQIIDSRANATGFSDFKGVDMFNITYDPSQLRLNDPMIELPADHPVYGFQRYNFNKFMDTPVPESLATKTLFEFVGPTGREPAVPGDSDPKKKIYERKSLHIEMELLHDDISVSLTEHLGDIYGHENVRPEHPAGHSGTEIDIVVNEDGEYSFYEIKTYSLLRICIREAIGQLFEYNFWTEASKAKRLIVVTRPLPGIDQAKAYFKHLRTTLRIPVFYQTYDYKKRELSELF